MYCCTPEVLKVVNVVVLAGKVDVENAVTRAPLIYSLTRSACVEFVRSKVSTRWYHCEGSLKTCVVISWITVDAAVLLAIRMVSLAWNSRNT